MGHALFPPSGAARWMNCPHAVWMAQRFLPAPDTEASLKGTQKHDEAAKHLEEGTDSEDRKMQTYLKAVRKAPGIKLVEHKVTVVPEVCWGTSDAIVVDLEEPKLYIFDLKWGVSPVTAVDNAQMKVYSVGALREYLLPRDAKVEMTIVQPNAKSGHTVKPWATTVDQVWTFREEILRAIDRGLNDNGPETAVAGSHCFWCPGKLHCPTHLKN